MFHRTVDKTAHSDEIHNWVLKKVSTVHKLQMFIFTKEV